MARRSIEQQIVDYLVQRGYAANLCDIYRGIECSRTECSKILKGLIENGIVEKYQVKRMRPGYGVSISLRRKGVAYDEVV